MKSRTKDGFLSGVVYRVAAGYLFAATSVAIVVAIISALNPHFPLGRFPIALALTVGASAYLFGVGPGLFAFVLALSAHVLLFVVPMHALWPPGQAMEGWASVTAYVIGATLLFAGAILVRNARKRAELFAHSLADSNIELERQERLLEAVTDNTEAHLVFLDRDFNFIWVNPAYARACARAQEEFIGHNHFEFYPNEENQAIFERVRDTGEPFAVKQKPFVFPDHPERGTTYWHWTLTPIKDSEGNVVNLVFSLLDVTHDVVARQEIERLRTEAERRAAELESFIASVGDGVALFDADGKIVLANEAGRRILGVPADVELADIPKHYRLYTMDGVELPVEQYASRRALRGETLNDARFRFATTWTEGVISISGSPVRDSDGRVVGAVVIFRDVREQIQFEERKEALYQREHKIADMLQQALIPSAISSPLPGCAIAARYQPAFLEAEVGGDFYDVFDIGGGRLGVLIGDVAGKGLLAAIRVAAARYAVRSYALLDPSPSSVMARANYALSRDDGPGFTGMVTAFFAVLDTNTGEVTYTNAGHEPPVLHYGDHSIEELSVGGPTLGILADTQYDESLVRLTPDDTLILVTDGITEARDGARLWGKEGLLDTLHNICERSHEEIADGILEGARSFCGGSLHDDAAVVVLRTG